MKDATWGQAYKRLGAKPVINAMGAVTLLGGSTPVPEIQEAMDAASSAYIPLDHLQEKAGERIARLLGVPAAYVTSGAGSALTLAAAAVMAGDDDDKIYQLPDTTGMKNEILIQRRQRYHYDHCLEASGAKLVEFGTDDGATREDLERAIGPRTAAVHNYVDERPWVNIPSPSCLPVEQTIEIAHAHGIPVLVDCASQVYPIENMSKWMRAGADFSAIGAKYLGSPHSTGFALGTKDLIRKLSKGSFIAHEMRRVRGIGRGHKLDRQEIVGAVVALERWVTMNHEERLTDAALRSRAIVKGLEGVPGLRTEFIDNVFGYTPHGVHLFLDTSVTGVTTQQLVDRLKEGDPPIWTRVDIWPDSPDAIMLTMFGLAKDDDEIVVRRIREELGA